MIPLLVVIAFFAPSGKPIKAVAVTCDGFVNYNVDEGATDDPMLSDSFGAVWLSVVPEGQRSLCVAIKAGYQRWMGEIVMDARHRRHRVVLKKISLTTAAAIKEIG